MLGYIVRRTLYMLPLLLFVSIVSFSMLQLMPGNYLTRLRMNPELTDATFQQMTERYGLDKPFLIRYWRWLKGIITRGDFGISFETRRPVFATLFMSGRLPWTLIVTVSTMLITWLVAIPIGIYSARHQYKPSDYAVTVVGYAGLSIPNFFLALMLLFLLVGVFRVGQYGLGIGGLFDNRYIDQPWTWGKFLNLLWHLWPAWLVIGTSSMAGLIRYMRGEMLDTLHQPYIQTAWAKGLTERKVIYKHALRNAINPLISMLGMALPGLLAGSLITARVLNLPTIERAYFVALQSQDEYVIMGGLMFFGLFLLVGNLLADILLVASDPRIRCQ